MAVIILNKAEDQSSQMSNNTITVERLMRVSGNSITEIATSSVIPQYGSRHPENSLLQVTDVNVDPVGNIGRQIQAKVTITYSNKLSGSGGGNSGGSNNDNIDPWLLGAQNISEDYISEKEPLAFGYDKNGKKVQLKNSAGSRLRIEADVIVRQISFTYAVKAGRAGRAPINNKALVNKQTEYIAGYEFVPYQAMLMPMKATFTADVNDEGNVYRRYWTISAVIFEHPKTWERSALDVGTMALFAKSDGSKILQPIYQYTPWNSTENKDNIKIPPVYGCIDDVIQAKFAYSDKFEKSERSSRWDSLPYSEITEPLPLLNGSVYIDAMKDPINNPYKTIDYFEVNPSSWAQWNLPRERA